MSKTYQTTGINLQGLSLGENDRLLTILTPDYGLIKAIAPGARKYKSTLRGRSELFVINDLLIVKGKSIDRIIQAETQKTHQKLGENLLKLTVSQYLAELTINIATAYQSQTELYLLFIEHLQRIEKLPKNENYLPYLIQAIFHLLVISGIAPQINHCCLSEKLLIPNGNNTNFPVGFSYSLGGIISLSKSESNQMINHKLTSLELKLLQSLPNQNLSENSLINDNITKDSEQEKSWLNLENILRNYVEFQLEKNLKTPKILDSILSNNSPYFKL